VYALRRCDTDLSRDKHALSAREMADLFGNDGAAVGCPVELMRLVCSSGKVKNREQAIMACLVTPN
jgi:hypothetical protein